MVLLRGHLTLLKGIFDNHNCGGNTTGFYWVDAKDAGKLPIIHMITPCNKEFSDAKYQ
jgi:hypothetical protein